MIRKMRDTSTEKGREKFEKKFSISWKTYWMEIEKAHKQGHKYTCKKVARHRLGIEEFYDPDTFTEKFVRGNFDK